MQAAAHSASDWDSGSPGRTEPQRRHDCHTVKVIVLLDNDIELDAVGRQFEPYPSSYRRMSLHASALAGGTT